jgi:hypothetical protein
LSRFGGELTYDADSGSNVWSRGKH